MDRKISPWGGLDINHGGGVPDLLTIPGGGDVVGQAGAGHDQAGQETEKNDHDPETR